MSGDIKNCNDGIPNKAQFVYEGLPVNLEKLDEAIFSIS